MSQWYYTSGGAQHGPIYTDDLQAQLGSGQISATEMVWREGMADWKPISQVPELATRQPTHAGTYAPAGVASAQAPLGYASAHGYASSYAGAPVPGAYYGGFWWRVLAYIIDSIVLWIPNKLIELAMEAGFGAIKPTPSGELPPAFYAMAGLGMTAQIALAWLYFALMESSTHQGTLGKLAVGLVVTDDRGQRINFGRATGRYFGKILSAIILCIGFLMVAFDSRKRGLHDMLANTLVWKKP